MMGLQGLLLLSFLLFSFHSIPSFGNSEGDSGLSIIKENPAYYGALDGDERATDQNANGFIMPIIDEVSISSPKVVNVANYGAKGDGSDATEVITLY